MGRKTWRISDTLVIRHDLFGDFHYLYAPRPAELPQAFFEGSTQLAREIGSLFLKVDPHTPLASLAIRESHPLQPRSMIIVDCRDDDARLLAAMHPKTRYNIRLAEKSGVRAGPVFPEDLPRRFDSFWALLAETARRERFSLHPKEHYRILLEVRSAHFSNELWCAELGGQVLAWAIVNWFPPSGTATYLHGASARSRREVMAPHLLHWEIISSAARRGFQFYDFGGIDETHWPGMTRFKKGFGGRVHVYPSSRDYVFRHWWYQLYRLQHRFRHIP